MYVCTGGEKLSLTKFSVPCYLANLFTNMGCFGVVGAHRKNTDQAVL